MFFELVDKLINIGDTKLEEALAPGEIKHMRDQLATPEICPMDFDVTILGWLARIELWGKLTYYHKDPENFRGKKKITKRQFVDRISDESLNRMVGKWTIKKNNPTKCTLRRDYIGTTGRHFIEEFVVDVKLRKELR